MLRALQRRLLMLAPLRARVERGESVDAVMTSMGKALFWKDKAADPAAAVDWSAERLAEAAARVVERWSGRSCCARLPDEAALGEALVDVRPGAPGARPLDRLAADSRWQIMSSWSSVL